MSDYGWVFELEKKVSGFLERLKEKDYPGFFHYSLSGDIYGPSRKWGLGNTVFAVKIYHILDRLKSLPQSEKEAMAKFIMSFRASNGLIFDPLISKKLWWQDFVSLFLKRKTRRRRSFWVQLAETRQAISALELLDRNVCVDFPFLPQTHREVEKFLVSLDWSRPWNAGSHFSHLVFFLQRSHLENKQDLIDTAVRIVERWHNPADGAWYSRQTTLQQKINGAMKVLTGLEAVGIEEVNYARKLIDLCLSAVNDAQACDNFNIVYVLYRATRKESDYRSKEVKKFAKDRLKIYRKYYFEKVGGFSFLPQQANTHYYGVRITRGLKEPDIHGTLMFLWGISLIVKILGFDKKLGFKILVP